MRTASARWGRNQARARLLTRRLRALGLRLWRRLLETDWRPAIRSAAHHFSTRDNIEDVATELAQGRTDAGTRESVVKLLLFVPSAFTREFYEPEGVAFPDAYTRADGDTVRKGLPYAGEPIYLQAREIARKMIRQGDFHLVDAVIVWSAEGKVLKEAQDRGLSLRACRFSEVTHRF